ncbi:MAG: ATP-dependent Clp protease ATP-binding subunit ClpC [Fimbriimonadaceae bacterium]|jgi:ATP-dependent Clp protease ATP-binding subunit ClpC|nr:ATP-dependent Clp protease ATP-binding subunit ClpC [Fimbriimonadaceae bacterium]
MAPVLCDICGRKPAEYRVRVRQDGTEQILQVCADDYERLMRSRSRSPLESLFGEDSGFGDFFGRGTGGAFGDGQESRGNDQGSGDRQVPIRRRNGDREGVDVERLLSTQTRELLQSAAQTAHEWGRREIDTEHLLFALAESDVAEAILKKFKINPTDLRQQIEREAEKSPPADSSGEMGVSPRVKAAIERAFFVSRELGHTYIGPEHLLIAVSEEEGLAGDILRRYGLTPEALRQQTVKVVGKGAEEGRVEGQSNTPTLDKFSRDLTKMAREGKLDPVIGRSKEIETTIEVLARRKKNNPVLIGEPGVGKTAIVEGLAQRVLSGDVPDVLRDKRLVELNINSMVAGSKYRGEFEERVKAVLDEITAHSAELIIFIDELHTIVGAGQGGGEGGLDIANSFKPALARGELNLIGATTLNEYQKHIEKDAALERRFQPVFIAEPTVEQTINILRGLRDRFEAHHKVSIADEAITAAAEMSDRYITNRFLPDKAIDLIDQAAARVRIGATSRPAEFHEREADMATLKREQDYASSRKQFEKAKDIEQQITQRQKELDEMHEQWRRRVGSGSADVRVEHIAEIVSALTGIPVTELTTEERQRLLEMESRLHQRVIGQDEAVKAVSDAVRLARAGLGEGRRPIANFLFLGPTGVGKTELAKALAGVVFGDEDAMIRVDMSEYTERHTVARLVGAPPGYVGYEEGGQLTERVRRRPYSVVLLDEIEKAHPDVHNILLQVFDDGRLTDGKGRVVDFTNTIIIATSNLGADIIRENLMSTESNRMEYQALKDRLMDVLRRSFRPEFLNRIDDIIVFHSLTRSQIADIVRLQLERVKRVAHGQGVSLIFDQSLIDHLAEVGFKPEFGARELRRQIRALVETKLAEAMLGGKVHDGDTVLLSYRNGEVVMEPEVVREPKEAKKPKVPKMPSASLR